MKLAITGKDAECVEKVKLVLKGLFSEVKVVKKKPDLGLVLGGDGSFLYAERLYPGVPKLLTRDLLLWKKEKKLKEMVKKVLKGKYSLETQKKLEASVSGVNQKTTMIATNDIVVRNKDVYAALRFKLKVGKKYVGDVHIGDGIVGATPFGSTGYFQSITRKKFSKGWGIAFNCPTKNVKPVMIKDGDKEVCLEVVRSKAVVCADNDPRIIEVDVGDSVRIKQSKQEFHIVKLL